MVLFVICRLIRFQSEHCESVMSVNRDGSCTCLRIRHSRLAKRIMLAGAEFGIRPIGSYAISAMRIEKGFRAFGHDLSSAESPLEAGLGWAIDWDKEFPRKSVLLKKRQLPLSTTLGLFRARGS